jgi:hypothetical protein
MDGQDGKTKISPLSQTTVEGASPRGAVVELCTRKLVFLKAILPKCAAARRAWNKWGIGQRLILQKVRR